MKKYLGILVALFLIFVLATPVMAADPITVSVTVVGDGSTTTLNQVGAGTTTNVKADGAVYVDGQNLGTFTTRSPGDDPLVDYHQFLQVEKVLTAVVNNETVDRRDLNLALDAIVKLIQMSQANQKTMTDLQSQLEQVSNTSNIDTQFFAQRINHLIESNKQDKATLISTDVELVNQLTTLSGQVADLQERNDKLQKLAFGAGGVMTAGVGTFVVIKKRKQRRV